MSIDSAEMLNRTYQFSLRVLKLCAELHGSYEEMTLGAQLFRSATAVATRYRSAQLAQSHDDFYRKMKICEEEADETCCWLDMLMESHMVKPSRLHALAKEAHEIASIVGASCITLAKRKSSSNKNPLPYNKPRIRR